MDYNLRMGTVTFIYNVLDSGVGNTAIPMTLSLKTNNDNTGATEAYVIDQMLAYLDSRNYYKLLCWFRDYQ